MHTYTHTDKRRGAVAATAAQTRPQSQKVAPKCMQRKQMQDIKMGRIAMAGGRKAKETETEAEAGAGAETETEAATEEQRKGIVSEKMLNKAIRASVSVCSGVSVRYVSPCECVCVLSC